jgi:hypothetical protein
MLNKINKIISILLTIIFIIGIFPPVIFAEPNQVSLGEVKGFNRAVIDSHFSKADRELNPEHWLTEAKFGVTQAICAWELIAGSLYDNPLLYEEAKAQIVKWSDEELEKRFSQWLMGRFFGKAAEEALINLSSRLSESQKNYSWHLDKDGNVIFDDKTGDPLVIRPNEEGREFSVDLKSWRRDTDNIIKNTSASFDNSMIRLYPELLTYIPEESRESMKAMIYETLTVQKNVIKQEFESIAAREERIFTNRRTRDIWSLRKKSDDEAAKIFTEKLISETDEVCKRGIDELNTKIELASAGVGDLAILGEEWLRLYKEQFERGLKAWEEAEERFFIRRIEWEQDSFKLFSEGEDIWLSAFNQFEEGRQKWELSALELFRSGENLFSKISEDFENTIASAKKEFELNVAIRINEGTNKVKALIDMYLVYASTTASLMDNIKFWQTQYGNNEKNIRDKDFSDWISQETKKLWKQTELNYLNEQEYKNDLEKLNNLKRNNLYGHYNIYYYINLELYGPITYDEFLLEFNNKYSKLFQVQNILETEMSLSEQIAFAKNMDSKYFSKFKFEALIEMQNSYNTYLVYSEKSLDARNKIYENYADLFKTGALKDLLSSETSSEDFFLDEYQIALLRAKALVLYWERKTQIADAVMAYAEEISAGRMTETEGLRAWEEAKAAYDKSLAVYESELSKLNEKGEAVQEQLAVLNALTLRMQKEEDKLNILFSEYSELVSFYSANMKEYYQDIFYERYNNLVEKYKELQKTGVDSVYYSALKYAILLDTSEQKEYAENISNDYWQNTCNSLSLLFSDYSLEIENCLFPDVQLLCQAIFERPGDFIENTAQFLLDFDNCFSIKYTFLQYEIDNWKDSFIEYITALAIIKGKQSNKNTDNLTQLINISNTNLSNLINYINTNKNIDEKTQEQKYNEFESILNDLKKLDYMEQITELWKFINSTANAENETHWRQYLINKNTTDEESYFFKVSSWIVGVMEDALFFANFYTNRVNDYFDIYSYKDTFTVDKDYEEILALYGDELNILFYDFNIINTLHTEIIKTAEAYEFSALPSEEIKNKIKAAEKAKNDQETVTTALREDYKKAANIFLEKNSQYDNQYNILKKAYNNTDQKRFEYEKQDAIQKWAGSSYTNTDSIDPDNCRASLEKAQTVLKVLFDISNSITNKNKEYETLFSAYEQSFISNFKANEAAQKFSSSYIQEKIYNENIYKEYHNKLFELGINFNYDDYKLPDSKKDWGIENIIIVKDGRLVFSRNDSMSIFGVNTEQANTVIDFFNNTNLVDGERFEISVFEEALRGLSERMSGYFKDPNKFMIWSYARNYLLLALSNTNGDLPFLNNYFSLKGELDGSLGQVSIKTDYNKKIKSLSSYMEDKFFPSDFAGFFQEMWNSLSETEKADLEFYTILTLTENNDYSKYFAGFKDMYNYQAYTYAYDKTYSFYKEAQNVLDTWYRILEWAFWEESRNVNRSAYRRVSPVLKETSNRVNKWKSGLQNNLTSINNLFSLYSASCKKLEVFECIKTEEQKVTWTDLANIFSLSNINTDDIAILKTSWDAMEKNNSNKAYQDVFSAFTDLLQWTDAQAALSKNNLEARFAADMRNKQVNETSFLSIVDNYLNGTAAIKDVKTAAEKAYGKDTISSKYFLDNMYGTLIDNLSMYMNTDFNFSSLFGNKEKEIILLTENTIKNKYNAELAAREAEWNLTRKDIAEKYNEWQNTAAQIFENGRTDWSESYKKLENAYKQWNANFKSEYERVNNEWAYAYLAGLEDKEKWLEQAADAANQASSEAFLSLVGAEGERLSRFIDTREPFGIRDAVPEAQALMANLLQSSGIVNMASAFNSINNYTGVISPLVKQGIGGSFSWDSAFVRAAASDFAREANAEIAKNESKKLAYSVRQVADEAIKGLYASVDTANQNFREAMDNMFIFNGLWRKNGTSYEKEIIKGSTLFNPFISETVFIAGYRNYNMEPVNLKTNLDDSSLAGLNSLAIQLLINNVYTEIQTIVGDIFGNDQKPIPITKNGIERQQSPGKFGAHIGYSPANKEIEEATKNRSDMFYDEGSGELGRLMSDFQYWQIIDLIGNAELKTAPWDKRIWDDDGSWFNAPSLRAVGTIAGAIIAGVVVSAASFGAGTAAGIALSVAICSASEITLGTLDVAFGYKPLDEVAVSVGKTVLTNTITSGLGAAFSGVKIADGAIFSKTLMAGTQTVTTGFATSMVSGITYSHEDGWGYSTETFISGLKGSFTGSLTSMASAFTTASLTRINSGLNIEKLEGFNDLNKSDQKNLNGLIGSLAGQGVNYALGNDFTLNVLNLNSISSYNSGLLELHLGHDGVTMNIGTGGADISIENLKSAYRGAQVWNVNTKISNYGNKNDFDALIALRLQYGYGDNVQKEQLWDILNGKALINTEAEEDITKTTINEDGKRVINLAGYQNGMSKENQYILGVVLGYEAYRDGNTVGQKDASGVMYTNESNFFNVMYATGATLAMVDRIKKENNWFDAAFERFAFNDFIEKDMGLKFLSSYEDYYEAFYTKGTMNFKTVNNGDYQNNYKGFPLFYSATEAEVAAINEQNAWAAFGKYKNISFSYYKADSVQEFKTKYKEEFEAFKKDKNLMKDNGYKEETYYSFSGYGCVFMCTKYGLETILGEKVDTKALYEYVKNKKYFTAGNARLLTVDNMAEIMTEQTNGAFTVKYVDDNKFNELSTVEKLNIINSSNEQYLIQLRIKDTSGKFTDDHSVMVSNIEVTKDREGNITGISNIVVANPFIIKDHIFGKSSYLPSDIARWDFFKVTNNKK